MTHSDAILGFNPAMMLYEKAGHLNDLATTFSHG
jgi:hypothetical protein